SYQALKLASFWCSDVPQSLRRGDHCADVHGTAEPIKTPAKKSIEELHIISAKTAIWIRIDKLTEKLDTLLTEDPAAILTVKDAEKLIETSHTIEDYLPDVPKPPKLAKRAWNKMVKTQQPGKKENHHTFPKPMNGFTWSAKRIFTGSASLGYAESWAAVPTRTGPSTDSCRGAEDIDAGEPPRRRGSQAPQLSILSFASTIAEGGETEETTRRKITLYEAAKGVEEEERDARDGIEGKVEGVGKIQQDTGQESVKSVDKSPSEATTTLPPTPLLHILPIPTIEERKKALLLKLMAANEKEFQEYRARAEAL
ncbi:hypothetical protein EJ02DRAFT_427809, partial [Clathrospora elynae]